MGSAARILHEYLYGRFILACIFCPSSCLFFARAAEAALLPGRCFILWRYWPLYMVCSVQVQKRLYFSLGLDAFITAASRCS